MARPQVGASPLVPLLVVTLKYNPLSYVKKQKKIIEGDVTNPHYDTRPRAVFNRTKLHFIVLTNLILHAVLQLNFV